MLLFLSVDATLEVWVNIKSVERRNMDTFEYEFFIFKLLVLRMKTYGSFFLRISKYLVSFSKKGVLFGTHEICIVE